ncbi:helix-turn-helix domain-containing protein [Faecalimonas sp.]
MQYNQIGNKIKELRLNHNLKQSEFANLFGVSMQAVSKWEHGGTPDIDILISIADYFELSLDELCGRTIRIEDKFDQFLYSSTLNTCDSKRMEQACKYCWSIFKGISGISTIQNLQYGTGTAKDVEFSRCRVGRNEGIAYFLAAQDVQLMALMPEPKDGFASILAEIDEYIKLFHLLSDPQTFQLFLFICTRPQLLFSISLAARETNIPEKNVEKIFIEFEQYGWLIKENADTDDGSVILYRPSYKEYFIFFLFFAQEVMRNPRFLYLGSVTNRTKPLLSNEKTTSSALRSSDKNKS